MMQVNLHKRIGLAPGFYFLVDRYGIGTVYMFRVWWSAITLTIYRQQG